MSRIILFLVLTIIFESCEKAFFEPSKSSKDYLYNFNYLWEDYDEKYAFFNDKKVDWNQVYRFYTPLVKASKNNVEFFNVMASMLNELKDGHVNIVSSFNVSHYTFSQNSPDNFEWSIIQKNYLSKNYYSTGAFVHDLITRFKGFLKYSIGYIRLSKFTGNVSNYNLDILLSKYQNSSGLIIDIRENPGGSSADVISILKRFISKPTSIYYVQNKNGKAHNDFTPIEKIILNPYSGLTYNKKVMVLIDRGTYSAGSFFSLATKAISSMYLIGDSTGGGLGLPVGRQLPNGWVYRMPMTRTLDDDGHNYETSGVPPDIRASLDYNDIRTDEIIERAIEKILEDL